MYSGGMVIFIAVFYLIATSTSVLSARKLSVTTLPDWLEVKMILLSVFYCAAAFLFFCRKNTGWIFSVAILLSYFIGAMVTLVNYSQVSRFDLQAALLLAFLILLAFTIVCLFNRGTRKTYLVTNKSYLIALSVYLTLMVVNFVL
jgi:hypothetical protein